MVIQTTIVFYPKMTFFQGMPRDPLNKLLRGPMAALRGAQTLAYLNDMSRVLRSGCLALGPLVTLVQGIPSLLTVAAVSFIVGVIWSWPIPISQEYSTPKTKISIIKGNLLNENLHLVIGTNDTFDTEIPIIISRESLQGQALQTLYGGDLKELDTQLAAALVGKPIIGTIAKAGKQAQYGVGTIATVKHAARLIFFLAYCEMDTQNAAHSTPDKVWNSLALLWNEVVVADRKLTHVEA